MREQTTNQHERFFLRHMQLVSAPAGKYVNNHFLGRGGNGTAFLVTCTTGRHLGLQMVLKIFHKVSDDKRRAAFLEEARILRSLSHPSIVAIYDEGEYRTMNATYPFAVIEYVPTTVRQLLVARDLDRLRSVRVILNCLSALNVIHRLDTPLVHRDIKPENILVSSSLAKLADFGLARAVEDEDVAGTDEDATDSFESTQWPGMPFRYRTPELVAGARKRDFSGVTTASDIYQLGTVFYELLTGFNPQSKATKITDDVRIDLRSIRGAQGEQLLSLIQDMLQELPAARPTAEKCLYRLSDIHKDICTSIAASTGEDV